MRRGATISFFLLLVSGIFYAGNLAVYEVAAHAFGITDQLPLFILGSSLGFLSASFIVATILGSRFYNRFTRVYYLLSAIWIGVFTYLFLASVIYGLLALLLRNSAGVAESLIVVVLAMSTYGVIHARKLIITRIEVSLPNLPPSWRGRTAVWISDVHLGQLHGLPFAQAIVAKVSSLSPDIIFIGGDLYDGTGAPDIPELTSPLKEWSAPLGTYFITGNHEEYGNREEFLAAVASAGMRILDDEMIVIDGLQLIGVDYQRAAKADQFATILARLSIDPHKPSLLLKHEPKDLPIAHAAGISFQISGHTHQGQLWPFNYLAELTHKGYAYGLKHYKDMQIYVSSGTGTWGPPMRVGTDSEIVLCTFK
jgi:predicted MPP superfamily phosphohydrolase